MEGIRLGLAGLQPQTQNPIGLRDSGEISGTGCAERAVAGFFSQGFEVQRRSGFLKPQPLNS